jgi:hypothetical protein
VATTLCLHTMGLRLLKCIINLSGCGLAVLHHHCYLVMMWKSCIWPFVVDDDDVRGGLA